jgi:hypothetical protein
MPTPVHRARDIQRNLREHRIDAGIIAPRVPAPDREREDEGGKADSAESRRAQNGVRATIRVS